jgi:hypothetical protein
MLYKKIDTSNQSRFYRNQHLEFREQFILNIWIKLQEKLIPEIHLGLYGALDTEINKSIIKIYGKNTSKRTVRANKRL